MLRYGSSQVTDGPDNSVSIAITCRFCISFVSIRYVTSELGANTEKLVWNNTKSIHIYRSYILQRLRISIQRKTLIYKLLYRQKRKGTKRLQIGFNMLQRDSINTSLLLRYIYTNIDLKVKENCGQKALTGVVDRSSKIYSLDFGILFTLCESLFLSSFLF